MPNMTTTTMMSALTNTQDALSILIAKIGENDSSVIGPVAYSIANKESLSIIIQKQFLSMVTDAEANGVDAETRDAVHGLGQAAVMKIAEKMAENMHSIIVSDRNNVESAHKLRAGAVQTIINSAAADVQSNVTAAIVAENRRNIDTERGVNNMKIRGYGGKVEPEAKKAWLEDHDKNLELHTMIQRCGALSGARRKSRLLVLANTRCSGFAQPSR